MAIDIIHRELSGEIIGAAMTVLNELKPGLDEKLYERALVIELQARGHVARCQKRYKVSYRKQHIGTLIPDLVVDDLVIVDAKVVSAFTPSHIAQMAGYLAVRELRRALLLNFHDATLDWKRIVR